jgi:site-specific recombinase XerD
MTSAELVTRTTTTALAGLEGPRWETVAGAWLASYASENTRAAYRRDLRAFAEHLAGLGIADPLTAGRPAVDTYARHLEELGLSPASRARKLAGVSSFYSYAAAEGVLDRNPAGAVRRPKVSADSPRLGMSTEQARRVVAAAEQSGPAAQALIGLCFGAGLRVSEALALTPADLTTEAGHQVARVVGKGGGVSTVPLSPPVMRLLTPALEAATDGGPIIRGPKGGKIDRHQAGRLVEALGRRAGLEHTLRPHDLRHACATLALEAGAPLHRVQQLLRHASPTTTQRYTHHRDRLDSSAAYALAGLLGGAA